MALNSDCQHFNDNSFIVVVAVWQRRKVGVGLVVNGHPEQAEIGEEKERKMGRTKKHTDACKSF